MPSTGCAPEHPHVSIRPSTEWHGPASTRSRIFGAALGTLLRLIVPRLGLVRLSPSLMRALAALHTAIGWLPVPRGTRIEHRHLAGVPVEWVHGPGTTPGAKGAVLHLHGGGWFFGGPDPHRATASRLSTANGNAGPRRRLPHGAGGVLRGRGR